MKLIKLFLISLILFFVKTSFAKDFNVAALYWSTKIEGQVAMKFGIEEKIALLNKNSKSQKIIIHPFIAGDGLTGVKNQVKQFNSVVKNHKSYDLVIIQPTDNAVLSQALLKANEVKLPVIAFDQYIVDGKLESFITSNNYQAGVLNAEYIAQQFGNSFEIKIILAEYPKVSSTVERVDGFFNTLKQLG
jgi:ribose transport system substrate-binding protein